jgi:hypothetical protein
MSAFAIRLIYARNYASDAILRFANLRPALARAINPRADNPRGHESSDLMDSNSKEGAPSYESIR